MATQAQCERALDLFDEELSRLKNVVGLGIVSADDEMEGPGRRGCAVAVYVRKKVPADRLAEKDRVPESLRLPGRKGSVLIPVHVIEQGEVRLESAERETL
jgi:hypothetical protein